MKSHLKINHLITDTHNHFYFGYLHLSAVIFLINVINIYLIYNNIIYRNSGLFVLANLFTNTNKYSSRAWSFVKWFYTFSSISCEMKSMKLVTRIFLRGRLDRADKWNKQNRLILTITFNFQNSKETGSLVSLTLTISFQYSTI